MGDSSGPPGHDRRYRGLRTMLWRRGKEVVEGLPVDEISGHLREKDSLVWVDLCAPSRRALARLASELSLDRRSIEDSLANAERPKATWHTSRTVVTVYATRLRTTEPTVRGPMESRLETSPIISIVLARGFVTVRRDNHFDMEKVLQGWQDRTPLLEHGPKALLHGLLDAVVDAHFDTIQALDDTIEELEDGLFDDMADAHELQRRTYRLRKELVGLRRVVLPMREVVGTVMRHRADNTERSSELDAWYTELYDHVLRASEWTDSLRDMVASVFETNVALQDARLNVIMKKLTGWAGIIAVPTAVTGWFGMNVTYPGINTVSGFLTSTVVIGLLVLVLYLLFKRRNWI
ncbi:magnesium transporter CorA family protein [Streptomyces xantholiticus]|uniref:Magnesium transporter CorA family protein n=1 Tax=Streptomyces xantholiticus TaxID=68285 RepID=A0ABV1V653_9ACTN